ncbi:MAG: O-antigen ligase family protein [Bacteroidetes bacterium]|nr:O-antigen ligase family protein [Bacteroidota bacterium]
MICFIAMLIPVHKTLASPMLILSFAGILVSGSYGFKLDQLKENKRYLLFAALFLIFVYGYFISSDMATAARDLEIKLYLFAIPVFYVMLKPFSEKEKRIVLWLFVATCILFIITALSIALYHFISTGENHFYYKDLLAFTPLHPSYAGMFQAFAAVIIVMHLLTNWSILSSKRKFGLLAALLLITLFIFLLTAKMAIASIFILCSIAFYVWGKQYLGKQKAILIIILGNICALGAMLSLPYTRERIKLLFTYNEVAYDNSVNSRKEIWNAATDVVAQNPILGTGTGDAEADLIQAYANNGFKLGVEEKYNAHNQYLQILVETGWLGLLCFAGFFFLCLRLAIKHKNYLYLAFLLLWLVNISTESMLETQSGVVFFSFFNALLALDFRKF